MKFYSFFLMLLFFSTVSSGQDDNSMVIDEEFNLPSLGEPFVLAENENSAEAVAAQSETCRKYAGDKNANVSEIVKAGCEPTLSQMSALMDNPVGNVAMLFTQFDFTRLRNGTIKKPLTRVSILVFCNSLSP